jgi:predicted ATP-dependent serine protease
MNRSHRLHTTLDPATYKLLAAQQGRYGNMNDTIKVALQKLTDDCSGPGFLLSYLPLGKIRREKLGVPAIDETLLGGIPRGSLVLLEGPPGAGKTSLALQFVGEGSRVGQESLFISFQESPRQLAMHSRELEWDLQSWAKTRVRLMSFHCYLPQDWGSVVEKTKSAAPDRLVLDPADSLVSDGFPMGGLGTMMKMLRQQEITSIMTCQGTNGNHVDLEFLANVVIRLNTPSVDRRILHIEKSRLTIPKASKVEFGLEDYGSRDEI